MLAVYSKATTTVIGDPRKSYSVIMLVKSALDCHLHNPLSLTMYHGKLRYTFSRSRYDIAKIRHIREDNAQDAQDTEAQV